MVIVSILPSQLTAITQKRTTRKTKKSNQKTVRTDSKIQGQKFSRNGRTVSPSSLEGRVIKRQLKEQKRARLQNKKQKQRFKKIQSLNFGKAALEAGLAEQINRAGGVDGFINEVITPVQNPTFTFGRTVIKDGKVAERKSTRGALKTKQGRQTIASRLRETKIKSKSGSGPRQTVSRRKQLDQVERPTNLSTVTRKTQIQRQRTQRPATVFGAGRSGGSPFRGMPQSVLEVGRAAKAVGQNTASDITGLAQSGEKAFAQLVAPDSVIARGQKKNPIPSVSTPLRTIESGFFSDVKNTFTGNFAQKGQKTELEKSFKQAQKQIEKRPVFGVSSLVFGVGSFVAPFGAGSKAGKIAKLAKAKKAKKAKAAKTIQTRREAQLKNLKTFGEKTTREGQNIIDLPVTPRREPTLPKLGEVLQGSRQKEVEFSSGRFTNPFEIGTISSTPVKNIAPPFSGRKAGQIGDLFRQENIEEDIFTQFQRSTKRKRKAGKKRKSSRRRRKESLF